MRALLTTFCAALIAAPALSQGTEVDVELALLVDVSRSMSPEELEIQRLGYAAALQSDAVYAAIRSGLLQTVALSYVEWAGSQEVIIDWTLIETRQDLDDFALALSAEFNPSMRRTSITGALSYAAWSIDNNAYEGLRRVIDISGDGPNNFGGLVTDARDAALGQRITINGLPLMTRDGMGAQWHLDDLDVYYQECVTGGPGSFVIPVYDWVDFADAVRRKLVLEIADLVQTETLLPIQFTRSEPYDCLIGEKIWEERRRYWDFP